MKLFIICLATLMMASHFRGRAYLSVALAQTPGSNGVSLREASVI